MWLKNLKVWDGRSNELVAHDAIEIKNGNIVSLAHSADISDKTSRDMGGLTAIPGLIDAHVHMCLDPDERDPFAHKNNNNELAHEVC